VFFLGTIKPHLTPGAVTLKPPINSLILWKYSRFGILLAGADLVLGGLAKFLKLGSSPAKSMEAISPKLDQSEHKQKKYRQDEGGL